MAEAKKLPEHIRTAFARGESVVLAGVRYGSAEAFPDNWQDLGYARRRGSARADRGLDAQPPSPRVSLASGSRRGEKKTDDEGEKSK